MVRDEEPVVGGEVARAEQGGARGRPDRRRAREREELGAHEQRVEPDAEHIARGRTHQCEQQRRHHQTQREQPVLPSRRNGQRAMGNACSFISAAGVNGASGAA